MENLIKKANEREQDHYYPLIKKQLKLLPSYIQNYFLETHLAVTTEYQYITEFNRFFNWLRANGISNDNSNKNVSLNTLANLKTMDVNLYIDYLQHSINEQGKNNSTTSINRTLTALRSLFKYLTITSENNNGKPYFDRNVMLKIKLLKNNETLNSRARRLERQMFIGDKKYQLLNFISDDYSKLCTPRALASYKTNKERDLALIAILLGTAARRSEIANLDIDDLQLSEETVRLLRKGGMWDIVPFAKWIIPYLNNYLNIRKQRYHVSKNIKALFVTYNRGITSRITSKQINNIVKKYTTAFGRPSTAHKLRHTTASELFESEKDIVLVAQQLGQSGTSATTLYTHVDQQKQRNAINKL